MTSSVWRHTDTWRHRSCNHSKQHMWHCYNSAAATAQPVILRDINIISYFQKCCP